MTKYGTNATNDTIDTTRHDPFSAVSAGLPDFSRYKIPKLEKCAKQQTNIPNGHKIYQMAEKFSEWS
jgi:hypothetical protein